MPQESWSVLAWIGGGVALLCLISLAFVDRPLALLLHPHSDSPVVEFARATTVLGKAKWYLVISFIAFVALRWMKLTDRANQALLFFLAVAVSGLGVDILKHLFGRARPKLLFSDDEFGFGYFRGNHATISFPSGHATTIAAVAVTIAIIAPRWRIPVLAVALWIAATRVLINAHYLSDVIAGVYFGAVVAVWLAHVFQRRASVTRPSLAA